jgi:hypothetical protein
VFESIVQNKETTIECELKNVGDFFPDGAYAWNGEIGGATQ